MQTINLSEQNTIVNLYMSEVRDRKYQQNRLLFRNNIRRIGEMIAYELSKTLDYKTKTITTPLGTINIEQPKDDIVVATVLRAGLPFHEGFLHVFDHADNAFVSAYRMYTNREHTEVGVHTEYMAAPSTKGKTLIIADPMLATGGSMATASPHMYISLASLPRQKVLTSSARPSPTTQLSGAPPSIRV